jgi:hypothetical protein
MDGLHPYTAVEAAIMRRAIELAWGGISAVLCLIGLVWWAWYTLGWCARYLHEHAAGIISAIAGYCLLAGVYVLVQLISSAFKPCSTEQE